MIAPKNGNGEAHSSEVLPKSTKVFVEGKIHAAVRVPFREIELSPTVSHTGRVEVNEAVTPAGRPEATRPTLLVKPPVGFTVIVLGTLLP